MTRRLAHVSFGVAAIVFYLGFFAMDETVSGTSVRFSPPWSRMVAGELNFWMSAIYFLLPAGIFAGLALQRWVVPACLRLADSVEHLDAREWSGVLALIALGTLLLFWALNQVVLLGMPITDDEYSARFGGQVLAMGTMWAPMPAMQELFPHLFILARDGAWSVHDFTGVQLAWAVSEYTGSAGWIFHLAAMLPVPALMYAASKCYGRAWAIWAGAIFLFSPMALTLSYTTHAHVVSRGFLAVAMACFYLPWRDQTWVHRLLGALALALALISRPFEVTALMAPLVLLVCFPAALTDRDASRSFVAIVVGAFLGLVIMGLHNYGLSGNALISSRFMESDFPHPYGFHFKPPFAFWRWWERFGANFSYNTMMLGIWFLGLPGVLLTALGLTVDRKTISLGIGLLLALGLALLHDDHGIHAVGPIHYSECAVPLTLLSVAGLRRATGWLTRQRLDWRRGLAVCALVLPVTFGTFSFWHGRFLHDQSLMHAGMYGLLADAKQRPAVLLAPQYSEVWSRVTRFANRGSWVFEWRRPHPAFLDEVLVVHDGPGAIEAVRSTFPERHVYRMRVGPEPPLVRVEAVP
jgi:hypothetical protein